MMYGRAILAWTGVIVVTLFIAGGTLLVPTTTLRSATYTWENFTTGFQNTDAIADESNIKSDRDVPTFIRDVLNLLLGFVAIIAIAVLVYGGFLYVTALGDHSKASTAKQVILYAVIGLVIIGIAGIAVNVVINEIVKK